ncbi:hypothetical protein [Butyrivibrio sp. JL13D10]|uniref:hypothetical protein n=1 Tax=Butyrivibrio sp. JL13D10 TaxID=3236815 RepID=UPI0038B42579
MWFLIPISFFITAVLISVKFRESMCDTIAVTGAVQILTLYALGFVRGMRLIYFTSAAVILIFAGLVIADYIAKKTVGGKQKIIRINRNRHIFRRSLRAFIEPEVFAFIVIIAGITFLTRDQIFTWWDDINFWASDAKQLYYMNGFPGKYGNVSPEFGDYPPVTSIFKWIFLNISSSKYREGLQFAGYYTLNGIFLMPLVKSVSRKFSAPATVLVFMLPGIINGIIFYGTPADVTMGIIYGALLYAIWDRDGHRGIFYYGRIGLYAAVLLLTKTGSIEWAVFALAFYFALEAGRNDIRYTYKSASRSENAQDKGILWTRTKGICIAVLFAGGIYASWLLLCYMNRRVSKIAGLGIKMLSGSYTVPENAGLKAMYFFRGMWTMPMHIDHNPTLDIPVGLMVVLIFAAHVYMIRNGIIPKNEGKSFLWFFTITGIFTYSLIFLAHITLFCAEDQYLDTFAMTNSIARYGAPFTMGGMYLIIGVALTYAGSRKALEEAGNPDGDDYWKNKRNMIYLLITVFILTNADYTGTYKALVGYGEKVDENAAYNAKMVDDGGQRLVEALYGHRVLWGHRVLDLRSGGEDHRVHNTYISKEVSPVPTVYDTLTGTDDVSSITEKIRKSHAEYVFAESVELFSEDTFKSFMKNGAEFEFWKLYKVNDNGEKVTFTPIYLY